MSTRLTGYPAAWLDHARRDAAHAWRMIRRMPGLATVVIVSLAIGIGVNAAIFSWIQALVFKPLPGVRDAAAFHFLEPRTESGLPGSGKRACGSSRRGRSKARCATKGISVA